MEGAMYGFIKYENLLLGAFLFSLFAVMYCAVIYIKVDRLSKQIYNIYDYLSDDIKNKKDMVKI